MDIIFNNGELVRFETLKAGDVFLEQDVVHMRLKTDYGSSKNAVSLEHGYLYNIEDGAEVKKLKYKFEILNHQDPDA